MVTELGTHLAEIIANGNGNYACIMCACACVMCVHVLCVCACVMCVHVLCVCMCIYPNIIGPKMALFL